MRDSATVEATVSVVVKLVEMKESDEGLNTPLFLCFAEKVGSVYILGQKAGPGGLVK